RWSSCTRSSAPCARPTATLCCRAFLPPRVTPCAMPTRRTLTLIPQHRKMTGCASAAASINVMADLRRGACSVLVWPDREKEPVGAMATQYKTKCPHCQAQFRISEEHLKQAKGQVRCGSCLKVFLATENLVPDSADAHKPAAKPAPSAPAKPAAAKPAAPATPETWSLPPEEPVKEAPASRWTLDDDGLSDDMKEADEPNDFDEEGIPEARPQPNDTKLSLGGLELSDSFMSLDSDDDNDRLRDEDFSDMAGAARGGQSEDSDESWAEKLLEELSDAPKPVKNPSAAQMQLTETEDEKRRAQQRSEKAQRKASGNTAPQQGDPDWARDSGGFFSDEPVDSDNSFGLLNDDDDDVAPIDLPVAARTSVADKLPVKAFLENSREILRWSALSVLMLLVLLAQHLTF